MCGNPTWALWSPLWAWGWWQSSSVCFSWGRKKFIQWQCRVPKSDPALSIVYRKRPRRELASCKPHSLVHSGYHGLWKCEGCRTSWHFKINILFSFTNLLHLVMHRQAEKPTVHEKWAWEVSMRNFMKYWVQCFVPTWLLIWEWWRLLNWRSPMRTSTRVTRYWTQQTTMSGMMHMGAAYSQSSRDCCLRILHVLHLGEVQCYYSPLLSHGVADTLYSSLALFASWSPVKGILNLISFGKEAKGLV